MTDPKHISAHLDSVIKKIAEQSETFEAMWARANPPDTCITREEHEAMSHFDQSRMPKFCEDGT